MDKKIAIIGVAVLLYAVLFFTMGPVIKTILIVAGVAFGVYKMGNN